MSKAGRGYTIIPDRWLLIILDPPRAATIGAGSAVLWFEQDSGYNRAQCSEFGELGKVMSDE
jgi:hypothetical protein